MLHVVFGARARTTLMANQIGSKSVSLSLPNVKVRPREPPVAEERIPQGRKSTRPKSAPSSPEAGRRLLTSRARSNKRVRFISGKKQLAKQRQASVAAESNGRQRHTSVTIVHTPAYTLSRSPTNVHMNINTAAFFGESPEPEVSTNSNKQQQPQLANEFRDTQRLPLATGAMQRNLEESMRAQQVLQHEVSEMSRRMEQQGEDHQEHVVQLEEDFAKEKRRLVKSHSTEMSALQDTHAREMEILHTQHAEELQTLRVQLNSESSKLQGELEFMKEHMQSTQAELLTEAKKRLLERERELEERHSATQTELESQLRHEAATREEELRAELERRNQRKEETLTARHKKELEAMLSQLADSAGLVEELSQTKTQVKSLEDEVSQLKVALGAAHVQQRETEAILLATQEERDDFKKNFKEKVHEVKEAQQGRMDRLMHENSELRKRLLHRTEQYHSYKSSVERSQAKVLRNFKERVRVVVQARTAANLGVAMGLEGESHDQSHDSAERPLSAPTTIVEASKAKVKASRSATPVAMETRPWSCLAKLGHQQS